MSVTEREQFEQSAADEAAEELAFEQAYGVEDQEPKPGSDESQPETQSEKPAEEIAVPAAKEDPPPELTVSDLKAMIEAERTENQKLRDKVFGKVGELQQRIDNVRSTAHGISPKAKERLAADFPELAEMLFDNEPEPQREPVQQAPPAQTETTDPSRAFEIRLLKRDHPDWDKVVTSPEFAEFKETVLDPQTAAELEESWDADFISPKITDFKKWKEQKAQAEKDEKDRQLRLDSAIIPRGNPRGNTAGGGDDSEEAAMMAAFKIK